MKRTFFAWFILLFLCNGCVKLSVPLQSREDFEKRFQKRDISELENKKNLTLIEAQKIALRNNPEYRSIYYAVNAARNRYYALLGGYLPKIDLHGNLEHYLERSYNRKNPPVDIYRHKDSLNTSFSLQASYLIFDGFERELSIQLAKNEYNQFINADEDLKRLLLRAVAYAYYDAILAREELRIAQADLDFQISALNQAENRYNSGYVSQAAVLNFKILANDAKDRIVDANYRHDTAIFALINLMGYSDVELPKLSLSSLDRHKIENLLDLETYLDLAIMKRPDLQKARLELLAAKIRKYRSFSPFMPELYFNMNLLFEHEFAKFKELSFDKSHYDDWQFFYGVSGKWNVFNGFSDYNRIKEMGNLEEYQWLQTEKKFLEIINEVKDAYVHYRTAREKAKLYQESYAWVFEQRKLVEAEYWSGYTTVTRLNEAQSAVVESESRLAVALINTKKAYIQLQAAINDFE